jgi:ABC-2 type transport system ATP-binding protein
VALYEHLSARENLRYFLRLAGSWHLQTRLKKHSLSVKLDAGAWDRKLGGFSKGMRQKVAIALALAATCRYCFLMNRLPASIRRQRAT